MKSPAFQFYPDDFMGGKPGMMTPEQTHVYIWLLCLDWNQGGFAFDAAVLARWCRVTPSIFRRAWTVVQECFTFRDGVWFNGRLEKERVKQAEWREKSAKGGKTKRQPPSNHPSENDATKSEPNGNTPVSVTSLQFPVTDLPATTAAAPVAPQRKSRKRHITTDELPPTTTGWVAVLGDDWKELTGGIPSYGKLAGSLDALIKTYGLERVRPAWQRFCQSPDRRYGPAKFAELFGDYDPTPNIINPNGDEGMIMRALGMTS